MRRLGLLLLLISILLFTGCASYVVTVDDDGQHAQVALELAYDTATQEKVYIDGLLSLFTTLSPIEPDVVVNHYRWENVSQGRVDIIQGIVKTDEVRYLKVNHMPDGTIRYEFSIPALVSEEFAKTNPNASYEISLAVPGRYIDANTLNVDENVVTRFFFVGQMKTTADWVISGAQLAKPLRLWLQVGPKREPKEQSVIQ